MACCPAGTTGEGDGGAGVAVGCSFFRPHARSTHHPPLFPPAARAPGPSTTFLLASWEFDACGACTRCPQATDAAAAAAVTGSRRSRLETYPVCERAGLLWLWPTAGPDAALDAAAAPLPLWKELDGSDPAYPGSASQARKGEKGRGERRLLEPGVVGGELEAGARARRVHPAKLSPPPPLRSGATCAPPSTGC